MQIRYEAARAKVPGVSVGKRRPNDKQDGETLKIEAPDVKRHKNTHSVSDVDFMALVAGPSIQRLKKMDTDDEKEGEVAETTKPKTKTAGKALPLAAMVRRGRENRGAYHQAAKEKTKSWKGI
jgi:hypothetical protein